MEYMGTVGNVCSELQSGFLAILPSLERRFRYEFSGMPPERRDEAIAEATALAWNGYQRVAKRGKPASMFAATIARFASKQTKCGRTLASPSNSSDVLSRKAQYKRGIRVGSHFSNSGPIRQKRKSSETGWVEALEERKPRNIPRQVAFRVDFETWLGSLSERYQSIIADFAAGYSTKEVSERFGVSAGRISQIRRELENSWNSFHSPISEK